MWQVFSSCSTFLPSIIKIFQRVFNLQSRQKINASSFSNITNGDNTKSKKGRVVILERNTPSHPILHFYQIPSKYSEGYSSLRANTKSILKTKQREITQEVRKSELSFLYVTHPLILFCISTKYHINIPKGIWLTEQTQNQCIIHLIIKYNKER